MQVRWTTEAARDLENIANYLFEKTPENAARVNTRDLRRSLRTKPEIRS